MILLLEKMVSPTCKTECFTKERITYSDSNYQLKKYRVEVTERRLSSKREVSVPMENGHNTKINFMLFK